MRSPKKKKAKLIIDLDDLQLTGELVSQKELILLRGLDPLENLPISEYVIRISNELKKGKVMKLYLANTNMMPNARRLLLPGLRRIFAGSRYDLLCLENGNELSMELLKKEVK